MDTELFFKKRIKELADMAYHRDIVTFTDFLTLHELDIIKNLNHKELGVTIESFGGYDSAERQIAAFCPNTLSYPWEYPIRCIKVEPKSKKFSEKLTHRDFLGALLNLGIERSMIGDIMVQENCAWFFCLERMVPFFLDEFTRVKHTFVYPELILNPKDFPKPSIESVSGTCSSVRLDSLISLAFGQSRSSMTSLIENGSVYVNGKMITSNGYTPKEKDLISVRGKGKFVFDGVLNQTKKGRISVLLYRYV